jgi:hypothetical protein
MRIFNTERSSLLLAPCAPSASWLPESAPVAILAAERTVASQEHQAQIQAELAALSTDGSYGTTESGKRSGSSMCTTGFVDGNGTDKAKQMVLSARGVPPRGRPV